MDSQLQQFIERSRRTVVSVLPLQAVSTWCEPLAHGSLQLCQLLSHSSLPPGNACILASAPMCSCESLLHSECRFLLIFLSGIPKK